MKYFNKYRRLGFAIFFMLFTLIFSCKEPDTIGLEVQPPNDQMNVLFSDTTTVVAYAISEDSVRTDETVYNLLGCYKDPVFGTSSASIFAQLRIPADGFPYGVTTGLVADSLILGLAYSGGYYGDIRNPQTVKVYEMDQAVYKDSAYYSNKRIAVKPTQIASLYFTPKPYDSVTVDKVKYAPHLRIKIDLNVASKLLQGASTDYTDNTAFLKFFKGICITTVPVNSNDTYLPFVDKGAILYFNLLSSLSRMTLYYRHTAAPLDTLKYSFVFNEYSTRINKFNHYHFSDAAPDLRKQVAFHDSTLGKKNVYLQSMAGTKVIIKFPYLKNYVSTGRIAINKAELILRVDDADFSISAFSVPPTLALVKVNQNGNYTYLLDEFEGASYFGGTYNSSKKEYRFTITRHLQNILNHDVADYGLALMVSGGSIQASRVVLLGTQSLASRLRLNLTYTKIN